MSQTIPISSTSKKRLDEKNGKMVKDLSLLLENRNCVECGMRGPTYVDVTTTSFSCATCAGVLRGINPPHRIKSISMATFTCEEVEALKNGGNEVNRQTWMGLHTGPQVTNFASKDDRTNFITDKYEKKKWYVSPSEVERQKELLERAIEAKSEQLKMTNPRNDSFDVFSSVSLGGSAPPRPPPSVSLDSVFAPPSMLGGVMLDSRQVVLDEPHPFSPPAFMAPPPPPPGSHPTSLPINQQPTHMPINFAFGSPPAGLHPQSRLPSAPPPAAATPVDPFSPLTALPKQFPKQEPSQPAKPDPFGADPFGPSSTTSARADPFGASSFSGFAVKFDEDTPTSSAPPANPFEAPPTRNPAPTQYAPSQPPQPSAPLPPSSDPFSSLGSLPSTVPVPSTIPSASPAVIKSVSPHPSASPSIPPVSANNDADKYSALAELDELFHSSTISGEASNGKPSWVSTGFSVPPLPSGPAFPSSGMGRSSTMGAISSIPSSTPSSSTSFWGINAPSGGNFHPFPQSAVPTPAVVQPQVPAFAQMTPQQSQYAQAAAMTGNPFAAFPANQISQPSSNGVHPSNPNWNPFL